MTHSSPPNSTPPTTNETPPPLPLPPPISPPKGRRKEATSTAIAFIRIGLIVAIGLIVFQWADRRYKVGEKIGKVSAEVWIGIVVTGATTYWQWYSEREKDKLEAARERAAANAATIKTVSESFQVSVKQLEGRIDSLMLQQATTKARFTEQSETLKALEKSDRLLDEKIDNYRYEVLQERFALLKSFYDEIRSIHGQVAYLKGQKEAATQTESLKKLQQAILGVEAKAKAMDSDNTTEATEIAPPPSL